MQTPNYDENFDRVVWIEDDSQLDAELTLLAAAAARAEEAQAAEAAAAARAAEAQAAEAAAARKRR